MESCWLILAVSALWFTLFFEVLYARIECMEGDVFMQEKQVKKTHPDLGVLCPVFSLPGNYGIGDFKSSLDFLDILGTTTFKTWQILPLNITGYLDSPYQALSSYGGDEMYIDLDEVSDKYRLPRPTETLKYQQYIDYPEVKEFKREHLRAIYEVVKERLLKDEGYQTFVADNPLILQTAKFLALKEFHDNVSWTEFRIDFDENNEILVDSYEYHVFSQYTFARQWAKIKKRSHELGITIMGDLPFYVGLDSADVYFNQDKFLMNDGKMLFKAGVPPDYFSATGQLWGNPIYDWEAIKADNYKFWLDRIHYNAQMYDVLRLDHFRAFDTYWQIEGDAPTAMDGEWIEGPAYEFFDTLLETHPETNLIVEDLGLLREEVNLLRDHYEFLGMSILQFLFNFEEEPIFELQNEHSVFYTGTHDNEPLLEFYLNLTPEQKQKVYQYFLAHNLDKDVITNFIDMGLRSEAKQVIIPFFDLLYLDGAARINAPGTLGGTNWRYRLETFTKLRKALQDFSKRVGEDK